MIYFVVAHDRKFGMGSNYKPLPWPLMPHDKQHLHELADGKKIVLGERTYRDYKDIRTAFDTTNVTVISTSIKVLPDAGVAHSMEEIVKRSKTENLWVIGGASIFAQLLPFVDVMHITIIEGTFQADVFFPEYTLGDWNVAEKNMYPADNENPYPYTFMKLVRKV